MACAPPRGFAKPISSSSPAAGRSCGRPTHLGGQGAPMLLATAVQETWASANLAFKLCPMLTYGAIHALEITASPELKQRYLPKMVTGEWTGTMVLTEPQAGSDLALIRTRAVPQGGDLAVDEFRLFGQKIFITWGEHDLTENIIHMVLARIDGAPEGVRGISLFLVPKFIGRRGRRARAAQRRALRLHRTQARHPCQSHLRMSFGEREGALGYLVGEANRGLEYMFIMMNVAAAGGGTAGLRRGRARLPAGRGLRAHAGAGAQQRRARAGRRRSSIIRM